ncbi:MAG: UDP-N-acetylmuramate dehydrogenase [Cyclobacteriaceae bacterium]|nr:UDP-N-acetylmuramate dehydrogenase [Cyclobacteriaceae bacterium]
MVKLEENVSLKAYNTFGINAKAKYLCHVTTVDQLVDLLHSPIFKKERHYILGGGSNVLFTKDFDGLIIKDEIKGIETVSETDTHIVVRVSAGENWHQFVLHAVANDWGGIENLSLIPGTVGAAPMQNIGAYGVEIKNLIERVEAIELSTGRLKTFSNEECAFGYRESVFKRELAKKYFISSVTLRLSKKDHQFNTTYGALQETLKEMNVTHTTIQSISDAVIHIRKSKLPDPVVIGNAGSFFKNPTIDVKQFESLQNLHSTIPGYSIDNQNIKVPAGWLIEQCGWKGKRINNVGVHPQQALVLVNYGNGSGAEILNLSEKIQVSVMEEFQIKLTPEVNIL